MKEPESEIRIKKVFIDPPQAQIYLLKNASNRPLSDKNVDFLVKAMRRGDWKTGTDAIGFDTNGNLINGQHRLRAIIKFNKGFEFLVATGLEPEAFNVIDTGKVRNAADILGVHGVSSGTPKSAIIRFVAGLDKGYIPRKLKGDFKMSNQQILEYAKDHQNQLDEAYDISVKTLKEFKGLQGRYVGGLYWLFAQKDRDTALLFFHYLATGTDLKSDDPIHTLRQRLLGEFMSKKKSPDLDKLAWTVISWNATRQNKKLSKIVFSGDIASYPKPL